MSNDDPDYHRTLKLVKLPPGDIDYIYKRGLGDTVEKYGILKAYQFQKRALVEIVAQQKKDQEFANYATDWERRFSKLCSTGHMEPVLDKNGTVIGHYGWMVGDKIFIASKIVPEVPRPLDELLRNETHVYILTENIIWQNDHDRGYVYNPIGVADQSWRVVTDITGEVVTYTHYKNRDGAESCWVSPLDIYLIGKLAVNLGVKAIGKIISSLATRLAAKAAGVETARLLTEEVAAKLTSRTGKLTAEEMEAHLTDILLKRPELRRLMSARVLSGEPLKRATLEALRDWERTYGRSARWQPAAEVLKKTGDPKNLMTLQGNELWINKEASVLNDPKRFYQELVHELAADSLGKRGTGLADAYLELPNGLKHTDFTILENAILRGDVRGVVRFFAGG